MVIASAKRLMEFLHDCRISRRIAEINVPAWPIPIHQTKLMMSKHELRELHQKHALLELHVLHDAAEVQVLGQVDSEVLE